MSKGFFPGGRRKEVAIATLLVAATAVSTARAAEGDTWKFEVTPYIWGSGLDGDFKVGNQEVEIDRSSSDTFDSIDVAGSLLGVAQYGSLVFFTQVDYLSLDSDELDDVPARGRLETDTYIGTVGLGYQFPGWREGQTFDVLLGARIMSLDNDLTLNGVGKFKQEKDFYDPLLIIRPSIQISKRWRFNPTLSYGEGGDSEETYGLQPQFQFDVTDNLALRVGYRKLHYDVKSDNNLSRFDGSYEGAILGFGGKFGYQARPLNKAAVEPPPVVAVAPPPPPPPPPPPDADRDGIVDAQDLCPNSKPGDRLDSVGCGYNLTLSLYFDHNSAELDSSATKELDRLAALLQQAPTVTGVIEAHTDSSGAAAYNLKLSDRRAAAAVDYLVAHGVSRGRLKSKGFGEAEPITDNGTAEGRALNRRVLLRRTDG